MKSVTIEAKTFAEMLGITEGELIFAIKKTGTFKKTRPSHNLMSHINQIIDFYIQT